MGADKEYISIIGLPSGEILHIPQKAINLLKHRGIISRVFFYSGIEINSYTYNDWEHENIVDVLSYELESGDW